MSNGCCSNLIWSWSLLFERFATSPHGLRVLYMSKYADQAIVGLHGVSFENKPVLQKPFIGRALSRKVWDVLDSAPTRV
jgi:hypothetical protein